MELTQDSNLVASNSNQLIFIIAQIGAANGMASRALARLTICCTGLHAIIQQELRRRWRLRAAWGPMIAPKLHKFLVLRSHPIKYSGRIEKIIPITDQVGINNKGFRFLDSGTQLFDENTVPALTNMWVITNHPVEFTMMMIISEYALFEIKVVSGDYFDTGTTALSKSVIDAKYGGVAPGRYIVNLRLPLRFNPLTLCPQIMDASRLCFCIYSSSFDSIEEVAPGVFDTMINAMNDFDLVMDNFTHVVAQYKTADATSHSWDDYGLMIRGSINQLVNTTSIIRKKSDTDYEPADLPYISPEIMEMLFMQAGIDYTFDAPDEHTVYEDSDVDYGDSDSSID